MVQEGGANEDEAEEAFQAADADGDGVVTRDEFVVGIPYLAMRGNCPCLQCLHMEYSVAPCSNFFLLS